MDDPKARMFLLIARAAIRSMTIGELQEADALLHEILELNAQDEAAVEMRGHVHSRLNELT